MIDAVGGQIQLRVCTDPTLPTYSEVSNRRGIQNKRRIGDDVVKSPIEVGINGSKTLTLTLHVNYQRHF